MTLKQSEGEGELRIVGESCVFKLHASECPLAICLYSPACFFDVALGPPCIPLPAFMMWFQPHRCRDVC